jgi:hypothetical protein
MRIRPSRPHEHRVFSAGARSEAWAADVQFTVALVAQTAAGRAGHDLPNDDTRTCVHEAYWRYRDAAWHYLNAAHLVYGHQNRPGRYDLIGLPNSLRSALRSNIVCLRHRAPRAMTTTAVSNDLNRLRAAVTIIRALLLAALPDLLVGSDHPQLLLERLRAGAIPATRHTTSLEG